MLEMGTSHASSWLGTSHASSWAPLMFRVGHLSCFELGTFDAWSWLGTFDASSRAPFMPRVRHLSCLKLGTFDASSWAPLMPRVGHLSCLELGMSWAPLMLRVGHLSCFELGTFDASSWAPLMLRVGYELGTSHASSWAPLMLRARGGHLSCFELGTFDASSWAPLMLRVGWAPLMPRVRHLSCFELTSSWAPTFDASSWAPLMPRVGHLSFFELGAFDASSWAPLMPGVGHLACLELGFLDASSWTPLMPGVGFVPAVGCFPLQLGTFDASTSTSAPRVGHLSCLQLGIVDAWSWASLMPRVGRLHASSWGPLMLRVGHLSCFDLGTFEASSWAPTFDASSWAPLMPRVGHLACLELGFLDASSWTPLMPGVGFLPAVGISIWALSESRSLVCAGRFGPPDGKEAETPNSHRSQFLDFPGIEGYKEATGIDLSVSAYVARKGQERKAIEGLAGRPGPKRQEVFEEESIAQILKYVKEKAKDPKPFFIYWATYCQQLQGVSSHFNDPHVDHLNAQASMMAAHSSYVTRLLDTLKEEQIAENTLVVWMSDNGPMYAFYPNSGYSWLRGGKGQVLEGGVRTPSMAWWPGMILANQEPVDLLHITDLYTTAARLGGALDAIPEDRVVDGVDQLPLLLLGEGHGRRKKIFFYSAL
ncbi:unnamed protein product, partial [Cladocopium goreaui]